jgi:prepilin-type N-terminal cleavage/methylation domain-containing protein
MSAPFLPVVARDFPAVARCFSPRLASGKARAEAPRYRRSAESRRAAFTLIELLTVVAIIGILAAILIPTAGSARSAANRAKTRAQFAQWAAGFEQFRQEYGAYPQLYPNGAQKLVNQGATPQLAGNHLFHDILAGVRRNGQPLGGAATGNPTPAIGQNPRRIRFVSFTESDFVTQADVSSGRATAAQLNRIRDAFYGTEIGVVADTNLDGVINGRDTPGGFPLVSPPGTATPRVRPTTVVTPGTTGGTRAGVLFYSLPPGGRSENDLILSWR